MVNNHLRSCNSELCSQLLATPTRQTTNAMDLELLLDTILLLKVYLTGFEKTDHNVTIDISRNANFK